MAIAKMDKITVVGLAADRDEVLTTLMRTGTLEIESREDQAEKISSQKRILIEQNYLRLDAAAQNISRRFPLEGSSLFRSKENISEQDFYLSEGKEKETLAALDLFEDLLSRENNLKQEISLLADDFAQIAPWQDIDLDLAKTETERTEIVYGIFSDDKQRAELDLRLNEDHPETEIVELRRLEDKILAAAIMFKEEAVHIRLLLQAADFHAMPAHIRLGKPNQTIAEIRGKIAAREAELEEIEADLAKIAAGRSSFWLLEDYYRTLLDRDNAASELQESAYTFWLSGWVPHDEVKNLVTVLQSEHDLAMQIVEGKEEDNYPIKLKNNKFSQVFEVILTMFGAPRSDESDPTFVMGSFYMLLFGMMLSDVGYGLILVAICALLLWKFKVSGDMQKMAKMLFISGLSSVAWGFVFGGFFGDMLTVLSEGRLNFPALWFNPMDDAMKLMIFSMIFGVFHLFAGMALSMRNARLQGRILDGLLDVAPWYLIITGLLFLAGGSMDAFGSASALIGQIGVYMALLGVVVVVLFGGRDAKNPIMRILKGILALYDVTGYFSDILSYTRILALVLATSVIAMVVNQLGFLLGPTLGGYILFIAIGLVGHSLNLALSALSAYVHASRLQYVEMFGKFFEGGGRYFKPLKRETKYYLIEDRGKKKKDGKAA